MQVKTIAECSVDSAILLTSIKVPFSIKTLVLSIFDWPLKTDFTVILMENPWFLSDFRESFRF